MVATRARKRAVGLSAMSAVAVSLLAGCDVGSAFGGFGWPQGGITAQSERMYDLWVGSVVAALAVGFFVWGLIFWCIAAYRRKRGDVDLPTQTRFNLPIEILYTVQVSFREHLLVPEPFVLVAMIAAVRRILVITAEFGTLMDQGESALKWALTELGLLTVMTGVLVACLVGLRKRDKDAVAARA